MNVLFDYVHTGFPGVQAEQRVVIGRPAIRGHAKPMADDLMLHGGTKIKVPSCKDAKLVEEKQRIHVAPLGAYDCPGPGPHAAIRILSILGNFVTSARLPPSARLSFPHGCRSNDA